MYYVGPRRRREKETNRLFKEIKAENFPNLGKAIDIQTQEAKKKKKNTK